MNKIIFVTGNEGKYIRAKDVFKTIGVEVVQLNLDIEELEVADVKAVSLDKAKKAFEILKQPCFVEDSGFYIEAYPNKTNFPGTLVKRLGISNNIEELLEVMKNVENRNCHFLSCITYYDGEDFKQFTNKSYGTLSREIRGTLRSEAKSRLWQLFIPLGSNKTLAETSSEERYKNEGNNSTTMEFANWYQDNFTVKQKIKHK